MAAVYGIFIEISSVIFDISMMNDLLPEGISRENDRLEIIHAGEFTFAGMGDGWPISFRKYGKYASIG
jgi:hypothetical protein